MLHTPTVMLLPISDGSVVIVVQDANCTLRSKEAFPHSTCLVEGIATMNDEMMIHELTEDQLEQVVGGKKHHNTSGGGGGGVQVSNSLAAGNYNITNNSNTNTATSSSTSSATGGSATAATGPITIPLVTI